MSLLWFAPAIVLVLGAVVIGRQVTGVQRLAEETDAWVTPEQIIELALKNQVEGIAFTYSEPAGWLEYVIDVGHLAREAGLYTVYVSNSYVTHEALEAVAPTVGLDLSRDGLRRLARIVTPGLEPAAVVEALLADAVGAA